MKDFPIGEIVPFGASYLGNRHFIYMSVFHISDPFLFIYWHIARQLTLGEAEGPHDDEAEGPPDDEISADEAPGEEVPLAEAENHLTEENDAEDEREIEVEGEGAPTREAKVGTLKAEAKTLAHLCEDETLPNRTWSFQKRALQDM